MALPFDFPDLLNTLGQIGQMYAGQQGGGSAWQPSTQQQARMNAWDQVQADSYAPPGLPGGGGGPAPEPAQQDPFGSLGQAPAQEPEAPGVGAPSFNSPVSRPDAGGGALTGPAALSENLRINNEGGALAVQRGQIGAEKAETKALLERQKYEEQEALVEDFQQRMDRAKQVSASRLERLQNARPEKLFAQSNGGQRELTIAAMVLAGFSDMVQGQPQRNSALRALQAGIEMHAQTERDRFDALLNDAKAAKASEKEIGEAREMALTNVEHRTAARWKVVEAEVDAKLASMAPGEQRVKAEQGAALIHEKAEEARQKAEKTEMEITTAGFRRDVLRRKAAGGSGPGAPDPDDPEGRYKGLNANQKFLAKAKDEAMIVQPLEGDRVMHATSPANAKALNDSHAAVMTIRDRIKTLSRFIGEANTYDIPGWDAANADRRAQITGGITSQLSTLFNTGVLQEGEFKRYTKMLAGGPLVSVEDAQKSLIELDREMAGGYQRQLQARTRPSAIGASDGGGVGPAPLPASRPKDAPGQATQPGAAPAGASWKRQKSTGRYGWLYPDGRFDAVQ